MKAYTDLEQSKKLAEILPLESADMYYEERCNLLKAIVGSYSLHIQCRATDKDYKKHTYHVLSPCWSLAALLKILSDITDYSFELVFLKRTIDGRANTLEDVYRLSTDIYDVYQKEAVDACYEMILKLHELNIL